MASPNADILPERYPAALEAQGIQYRRIDGEGPHGEAHCLEAQSFLYDVANNEQHPEGGVFLVAQLRRGRVPSFLYPYANIVPLCGVLPKPNTSDIIEVMRAETGWRASSRHLDSERADNGETYPVFHWNREYIQSNEADVLRQFEEFGEAHPEGVVIADIGGYFAPIIGEIKRRLGDTFCGVVEDTKNGEDRYRRLGDLSVPVFSVANSPNKTFENHCVGQEIYVSSQRRLQQVDKYRKESIVLVIGQGPVGSSIAEAAQTDDMTVITHDSDPAVGAIIHTNTELVKVLSAADVIFSATGNQGLDRERFQALKRGAEVVLATSGDDELDLVGLMELYEIVQLSEHDTRSVCYSKVSDHYFYLTCGLRSANFDTYPLDWRAVLPLQGEIIRASQLLLRSGGRLEPRILELPQSEQERISQLFRGRFGALI